MDEASVQELLRVAGLYASWSARWAHAVEVRGELEREQRRVSRARPALVGWAARQGRPDVLAPSSPGRMNGNGMDLRRLRSWAAHERARAVRLDARARAVRAASDRLISDQDLLQITR